MTDDFRAFCWPLPMNGERVCTVIQSTAEGTSEAEYICSVSWTAANNLHTYTRTQNVDQSTNKPKVLPSRDQGDPAWRIPGMCIPGTWRGLCSPVYGDLIVAGSPKVWARLENCHETEGEELLFFAWFLFGLIFFPVVDRTTAKKAFKILLRGGP